MKRSTVVLLFLWVAGPVSQSSRNGAAIAADTLPGAAAGSLRWVEADLVLGAEGQARITYRVRYRTAKSMHGFYFRGAGARPAFLGGVATLPDGGEVPLSITAVGDGVWDVVLGEGRAWGPGEATYTFSYYADLAAAGLLSPIEDRAGRHLVSLNWAAVPWDEPLEYETLTLTFPWIPAPRQGELTPQAAAGAGLQLERWVSERYRVDYQGVGSPPVLSVRLQHESVAARKTMLVQVYVPGEYLAPPTTGRPSPLKELASANDLPDLFASPLGRGIFTEGTSQPRDSTPVVFLQSPFAGEPVKGTIRFCATDDKKPLRHLGEDLGVRSLRDRTVFPVAAGIVTDVRRCGFPREPGDPDDCTWDSLLATWSVTEEDNSIRNFRAGGVGNYVAITHGARGPVSVYMHLQSVDVRRGERVNRWTPIGHGADAVLHPWPHVHLELRSSRATGQRVPPNLKYGWVATDGRTKIEGTATLDSSQWCYAAFLDPALAWQRGDRLPDTIRRHLDAAHAGWSPTILRSDTVEYCLGSNRRDPNLISGDFDGDGELDYAVLVMADGDCQALAFLSHDGMKEHVLEKGERDRTSCTTSLLFVAAEGSAPGPSVPGDEAAAIGIPSVPRASPGVATCESASRAYIWKDGKFVRYFLTD